METISTAHFRRFSADVLRRVKQGETFVLTYRGKPMAYLKPALETDVLEDDPIYRLHEIAASVNEDFEPLRHDQIDQIVYEIT